MIKEVAIAGYLAVIRAIFTVCRVLPVQNKTVMLASFGDNIEQVAKEVSKSTDSRVVILKEPGCRRTLERVDACIGFTPINPLAFIRGLYHLATARVVFVDNYHLVLAGCPFSNNTTCIQLWHANGAVKLFGLKDKTITKRPASAHRRFKKVYSRFDYVVVSSDEMAEIFKQAFGLGDENILKTGMPRTDRFHSEAALALGRESVARRLPETREKRIILYAPTFRDDAFTMRTLPIDVKRMAAALSETHHLLIHLHPAVTLEGFENTAFATDTSKDYDIFDLLSITDVLITDYSSVPFEFSTLHRPMIFHLYDLEDYEKKRGMWFDYEETAPGPVVRTTEAIIRAIQDDAFDMERVKTFDGIWNKYADGQSTKRLIEWVYENKRGH